MDASNVLGAFLFALIASRTGALKPQIIAKLVALGVEGASGPPRYFFWSGIVGGMDHCPGCLGGDRQSLDHRSTGHTMAADFRGWHRSLLPLHCRPRRDSVAGSGRGVLPPGAYFHWLLLATTRNIVGGVVIVSMLNYGQVRDR
jgi:hypothetical protein